MGESLPTKKPKPPQPAIASTICLVWLIAIGIIAFIWHLGAIGLVDETEPLFAEAARQMTVTGDWITPYFNGETRFDKPPLIYWFMALCYQALGVNPWAVRLPSALAAIALGLFGCYTLRRFGRSTGRTQPFAIAGCIGGTAIMLNVQTIAWARMGVSDMLLSACMGAALFAFFFAYATPERHGKQLWYQAFYIFCTLAVLTKGPVGIILPGLIIVCFLAYMGNLKLVLGEMNLKVGLLLFFSLTLPWYILVTWANGWDYINSFFGYHNIERFTSVVNHHSAPFYFYIPTIFVGFLPWSVYLPVALFKARFWQRRAWLSQPRSHHLPMFAFFWFICIFGFFTIAVTKLPSYVLPLMPACAILVALVWSEPEAGKSKTWNPGLFWSGVANIILCLAIAAIAPFTPPWLGTDPAMPNFGTTLQESGLLWQITGHHLILAIVLLVALLGKWWRGLWTVNAIAFAALMIFIVTPMTEIMDQQRQLPLRELAQTVTETRQPSEPLMMIGFWKPSLNFYTQNTVIYGHHSQSSLAILGNLIQDPEMGETLLILGEPKTFINLEFEPQQYQVLDQQGVYQLVRISKAEVINTLNKNIEQAIVLNE
ncbi:glycosyltransferase family 39 protein [Roseofilum sp. BLCC_M91]|uniref:Glycosyltransferase family 39 protein n=1 Tax=Roseofilum halophilum BLCC-M91 TaxID=3022259 RepID=A0ABT7BEX6_9CYAN|nr:glycosyltransferase family 39 protein [Roseofilum halophilum]MDJ1177635.1 glycosyltransferase family 39 protein [Roseofilum halophilum BLCC-M91]